MSDAGAAILPRELRHVVQELQDLVGKPIRDAWVPTPTSVLLDVGGRRLLVESWPSPRFHPVTRRPKAPPKPYSFQGLLRARMLGRLDALRVVGDDRVVEIVVGDTVLHARLFGRGGGIWLLQADHVLAASTGPAPAELPPLPPSVAADVEPRFAPGPGEGWADAAARWLGAQASAREAASLRRRLQTHLGRQRTRERRLVEHLQQDLEATSRADQVRHQADCLAAGAHLARRGLARVEVPDVHGEGVVTVPLDPALTPGANVGRLYDRAKRLERGAEAALERLDATEIRVRALDDALAAVTDATLPALRDLAERWALPPESAPRDDGRGVPWATWRGPGGEVAWVGRSDTANHTLVFRRARGRDWWVHVRDRPGAHVVLPSDKRGDAPPLDVLLAAAQLAFQAARVPAGERLDVQYARVADLSPIKGAGPGRVAVRQERVLHVVSDPARLEGWVREEAASR